VRLIISILFVLFSLVSSGRSPVDTARMRYKIPSERLCFYSDTVGYVQGNTEYLFVAKARVIVCGDSISLRVDTVSSVIYPTSMESGENDDGEKIIVYHVDAHGIDKIVINENKRRIYFIQKNGEMMIIGSRP
jgi:hypothetical protein